MNVALQIAKSWLNSHWHYKSIQPAKTGELQMLCPSLVYGIKSRAPGYNVPKRVICPNT